MAWKTDTFDAILLQFGPKEQEVIDPMRNEMKPKSFIMCAKEFKGAKQTRKKITRF
jgi:uncharacterized protein (TIGR03643 family)